jgi:peptidoglycan hydrolase-like protein with peptidoglycan-binding domain
LSPNSTPAAAELAVEHVVQECGVSRGDVFVQPTGGDNTSGNRPAGTDAKAAPKPEQGGKFEGAIEVSVDFHGEDAKQIKEALKSAGAKSVRTK